MNCLLRDFCICTGLGGVIDPGKEKREKMGELKINVT